jgi:sortase A
VRQSVSQGQVGDQRKRTPVTISRILARGVIISGLVLCLTYAGSIVYRAVASRAALRFFEASRRAADARAAEPADLKIPPQSVDRRLWSPKRVAGYFESLALQISSPLAVLRVPKAHIEVPVFEGTDELVLNRGVGRIMGTALPGEAGNVGIAGHRDGFFRGLKDIMIGDAVVLETARDTATYVVDRMTIVTPTDVSVLAPTATPTVTLVTCYPFYFIGSAPRRYILRCSLRERYPNRAVAVQQARLPAESP